MSKLHQHPISSCLTLSVKQLQPVMAELKEAAKLFKQHKRLLTNSYHKLCRYIAERSVEPFESHRTHMIGLFKEFDELFDSVIDILVELQRDELMTPLLDYFKDEEAEYMHYLQVLESAVANFSRLVPPDWEPFQGSVKPNPIASLPDQFPASESKSPMCFRKSNHVVWTMNTHHHLRWCQILQSHPHIQRYVLNPMDVNTTINRQ